MSFKVPKDFVQEDISDLDIKEQPNSDVYLIRVPKGFDVTKLHGTKFSPNEVKKIEIGEETNGLTPVFELVTLHGQSVDVTPLVKSAAGKDTLGPKLAGYLSVNKSYSVNPDTLHVSHSIPVPGRVQMPEGLKERFTPFGADSPVKTSSTMSKKKKRKRSSHTSPTPEIHQVAKRRKTDEAFTPTLTASSVSGYPIESPNKKKHKKRKHGSKEDYTESPQDNSHSIHDHSINISEHSNGDLFTPVPAQGQKKKTENVNIDDLALPNEDFKTPLNQFKEKHHKKKHSSKSNVLSFDNNIFIDRTGDAKMKTPDLLDGHIESSAVSNDGDCSDSSGKKKKRKLSSGYVSGDTSLNCSSSSHVGSSSKKKKKKRKHSDND